MELLSVTMNDGVVKRSQIEGKDNSSEDKSNYKIVRSGDLVYNSMRMWQGANGISKYDGIVSPAYTVLKAVEEIDEGYFAALFKTVKLINEFRKNSQGLTSDTWNLKYPQIAGIRICIPKIGEQHKISSFLQFLDKRIDAQRRLVEALKSYKRGVSTAIFNESLHIGSDSKWKEFSLGDFCTVVMGQSPDSTTYNNDGLGLPLVQGNADIYEGVTWPQHFTSAPTKIATANSILLSVRAPVGSVSIANQTVCIGRGVCSITSENMDFLYQLLVHIQDKWKKIEQGGTFTAISGDDIRRFRVTIPCVSDQIIIGSFLGAIDSLINNNKAICVALSKLKSAFLQILFI